MKKIISSLVLLITVFIYSCDMGERIDGNGRVTNVTREINKAEKIKVEGGLDVFVEAGEPSIRIEADENLIPYIETAMDDDWLKINTREGFNLHSSNDIKIYVTTPTLTDISVTGSGNLISKGKFATKENTSFRITGSGDIEIEINAPKVEADITGSGNLNIAGETRNVEIEVTGSGNYNGSDLKSENAVAKVSGSGDISLFADENLKAHINGSGNIKYRGNPTVDSHIAGSGTVVKE